MIDAERYGREPGGPYLVQAGERLARAILGAGIGLDGAAEVMGLQVDHLAEALRGNRPVNTLSMLQLAQHLAQVGWGGRPGSVSDIAWWLAIGVAAGTPEPQADDETRRLYRYGDPKEIVRHVLTMPGHAQARH